MNKKHYQILFVLGGGIGNIIQATSTMRAIAESGHEVDILINTDGTGCDLIKILSTDFVRNIYLDKPSKHEYDFQFIGRFAKSLQGNGKKVYSKIKFRSHHPEAEYYYNMAKQIGIEVPLRNVKVNVGVNGPEPKYSDTIAIYPGCKNNFAMKRWDKYDELAARFSHVTIVGTKHDICSHGKPTWIKKPWSWPKNTEIFIGTLQESAHYISKCKFFIGNDGGLAHVAAGTGVPTFVIFGPTSIVKNKPYCDNAHAIALSLPCQPCQFSKGKTKKYFRKNAATCPLKMKCMRKLTVDMVFESIRNTLGLAMPNL